MKILYGIQGTGNGHVTRSTQVVETLKKKGAAIDVIFSGCDATKVFDRSVFTPKAFYKGFTFTVDKGRIKYLATARNLSILQFAKDVLSFDAKKYDLVVTDFEPVSAMIAKKNKLPCIGIGHQYAFSHNIPMDQSHFFNRLMMNRFAPADYAIGLHWHHFNQPIAPPVIPKSVRVSKDMDHRFILVYLPFEHPDHIQTFLSPFTDYRFAVYGSGHPGAVQKDSHITWHPVSKTRFYQDLSRSSGVICNAGFELPSEALFLGKKILAKPLKGQFEQISNALALKVLSLGMTMESLDTKRLNTWLSQEESGVRKDFPDVGEHIGQWIMDGNWSDTAQLVERCWH